MALVLSNARLDAEDGDEQCPASDGLSEASGPAFDAALKTARRHDADLVLLHVLEPGPSGYRKGRQYTEAQLEKWLPDPASQDPNAHMPRLTLTDEEIRALARRLSSLR